MAVISKPALREMAAFIVKIKDSLEESNLPYKVDLVVVEDLAKSYEASIMRDRIAIE